MTRESEIQTTQSNPEVDLAKAALDATNKVNNDLLNLGLLEMNHLKDQQARSGLIEVHNY